jgi:alkanesulfonate monooxygenase SsuD/methylene tetrahydromethanopterin reductase-like flavin-dependent oxidoreductase (luciferase family)
MIRFGALLRQADNRWERIAESARICDDLGFHAIQFIDHLLAIPDPAGDILESWTNFVCLFTDGGQPETVRLFGEKVLPAFR